MKPYQSRGVRFLRASPFMVLLVLMFPFYLLSQVAYVVLEMIVWMYNLWVRGFIGRAWYPVVDRTLEIMFPRRAHSLYMMASTAVFASAVQAYLSKRGVP